MKLLSIAAALATLALTPARGDFATQKTNRVNLALANVCDGNFRDFRFQVSGYDDQAFVFNYDTALTDLACTFRLTKPMDGTVYLDVPLTQITVAGTSVTFQIARTNIPPPGNYYGELLSFQANSTNYYRSLAQGTLPVTWSLYLNESNFFQRATNAAGVGQVYVHPNWIDPPWLSTNAGLGSIYYTIANSLLLSGYVDSVYATIGPLQAATNYLSGRNTALTAGTNNLNTRVATLEGIEGGASWSYYPATQNVNAAGFTISNAVFVGNGAGLSGIIAATTAGVNSVSATGAVSGNLVFEGSGVTQTNGTFNFNAGVTSVADLEAATNALDTRMGAVETATNALDVRVTATEAATNVLNDATNSLDGRVTANTAATNALNVRVLATETATGVLHTAVGALQTATNALDVRAGAAEAATNALNTRAGATETATNALTVRMGAVETATGSLNVAVGALNTATGALNTAVGNLATATQELVAATGALNSAVSALNTASNAHQVRIVALEGATNALNTRVGTLETGTNALNARGLVQDWSLYDAKGLIEISGPLTTNLIVTGGSVDGAYFYAGITSGKPAWTNADGVGVTWDNSSSYYIGIGGGPENVYFNNQEYPTGTYDTALGTYTGTPTVAYSIVGDGSAWKYGVDPAQPALTFEVTRDGTNLFRVGQTEVWMPTNAVVYFGSTNIRITAQGSTNFLFMAGTNSANFGW